MGKQDSSKQLLSQLGSSVQTKSAELANVESDIQELSTSENTVDSKIRMLYGRNLQNVMRKLSKCRFRGEVVGPLLLEVSVREGCDRMSEAIERALWSQLGSFIVTDQADEIELSRILREEDCARKHTIIRVKPEGRYNTAAIDGATTVADALNIPNDLVFNVLVDRAGIERQIIVQSEDEVKSYMNMNRNRCEWKDSKISSAITYTGTSIRLSYGNYFSEDNLYPFRNALSKDTTSIISQMNERVVAIKASMAELQAQRREAEEDDRNLSHSLQTMEKDVKNIVDRCKRETKMKTQLENELNEIQSVQAIDTTDLEDEVRDLQSSLDLVENQTRNLSGELTAAQLELTAAQRERKVSEDLHKALEQEMQKYESEIQRYISLIADAKRINERAQRDYDAKTIAAAEAERSLEAQITHRVELAHRATIKTHELLPDWDETPPVLNRSDTENKLKSKLKATQDMLNKEKASVGLAGRSKLSVTEKMVAAKSERDHCRVELETLQHNIELLSEDFDSRKKNWTKQLKASCKIVSKAFDTYMQDKGQSGAVMFNHNDQTLALHCKTDNTDDKSLRSDVRQLSGGERSFTTLCLLLALGHVVRRHRCLTPSECF
jgi:chromosome segregation ATPase